MLVYFGGFKKDFFFIFLSRAKKKDIKDDTTKKASDVLDTNLKITDYNLDVHILILY